MKKISLNEKVKNIAKLVGIVLVLFFLYGLFSLFTGKRDDRVLEDGIAMPMDADDMMNYSERSSTATPGAQTMMNGVGVVMQKNISVSPISVADKKVIRNGYLSLKVSGVENAVDEIRVIAERKEGEIFSTDFYEEIKGQKNGVIVVRVPVAKFDETMNEIKEIATQVVGESTSGQDVTEQYTDIQTQIRNKKAEEESFVKILDKAVKVEDVLATTRELARVRTEIEILETRNRVLEVQTDMSIITVTLSEDVAVPAISDDWRIIEVVKESFRDLQSAFQSFVNGLIRFLIVGIPSLIPFALLVWFVYWVGNKIVRK